MIILASTSPTRQSLLANAGIVFQSIRPDVDETALIAENPDWTPSETSNRLATEKALDVSRKKPTDIVIAADQVLVCEGKLYAKPRSENDARDQIVELRGRQHALVSSVVTAIDGVRIWSITQTAVLKMRNFSDAFLQYYLAAASDHLTSSVGGYQLERQGLQLFESIEGDYFTILGLPLLPLLNHLRFIGQIRS